MPYVAVLMVHRLKNPPLRPSDAAYQPNKALRQPGRRTVSRHHVLAAGPASEHSRSAAERLPGSVATKPSAASVLLSPPDGHDARYAPRVPRGTDLLAGGEYG